jgi:hypothetical protein
MTRQLTPCTHRRATSGISARVATGTELQIQPYEGDGLSLNRSDEEMTNRIKLDGNDHQGLDPNEGIKALHIRSAA